MIRGKALGSQRATPTAASNAALKLADGPMNPADVVRQMTGGSVSEVQRATEGLVSSFAQLQRAQGQVDYWVSRLEYAVKGEKGNG